nr:MAG TPA: hypothetical protein [Caudoviricetes sp.]DAT64768.1 MAG TPA: hypothetical protein [Caudoviricetes sp.]
MIYLRDISEDHLSRFTSTKMNESEFTDSSSEMRLEGYIIDIR